MDIVSLFRFIGANLLTPIPFLNSDLLNNDFSKNTIPNSFSVSSKGKSSNYNIKKTNLRIIISIADI